MKTQKVEIPAVEVSATVAAKPETIFRFFTDPVRFAEWLGASVELTPKVRGSLRIDFSRHQTIVKGEVVELVRDSKIVFTWGVESGSQADSIPPPAPPP